MTVVEELVSVLGLEIGEGALATLSQFRTAVTKGLAGVGGVVAALGAAFAGTVVSVATLGAEINTTAIKLGIGTDALQEMKYAAEVTNVHFDSLTTAMKFLSKNAAEGGDGAKRITEALGGIGMRNANGQLKTADELIESFADKIVKTKDPIEQVKIAMHGLHGQSGVEIMPLLKLGGEGIRKLRAEAQDLAYVLDSNTIKASARFNVSLTKLKYALMGVRNSVGGPFINDFADGLDWMTERVRASREWFLALAKDIRELGQRFGRIVDVGRKAFDAIHHFVTQNKLDKLADAVHWVDLLEAALIGVATVAAVSAAGFAASWLMAAAPFIIIATLIGLIVDDIAHFLTGGESVLGMAEKWSHAFDPNDSNLIKFFKNALDLLFDLGDPAKWRRVVEAAKELGFNAISALNGWGDRGSSTARLPGVGDIPPPSDTDPKKRAQMEWERFNRSMNHSDRTDFVSRPPAPPPPSDADQQASNDTPFQRRMRQAQAAQDAADQAASDETPFQKRMRDAARIQVEINVHGTTDPETVARHVMNKFHEANSDAKAAIGGGT